VDISAPTGTPIRATADGIVVFAETRAPFGRLVKINHGNGVETYYAHLSRFYVQAGQDVRRGELIGAVGTSGALRRRIFITKCAWVEPGQSVRYLAKTSIFQQPVARTDFPF